MGRRMLNVSGSFRQRESIRVDDVSRLRPGRTELQSLLVRRDDRGLISVANTEPLSSSRLRDWIGGVIIDEATNLGRRL